MTNAQSLWMNQVLFKTFYMMYDTMSETKYNPVQSIYTVLASVCSTWRRIPKLTPAFNKELRQCFNDIGNDLLVIYDKLTYFRTTQHEDICGESRAGLYNKCCLFVLPC